MKKNVIRKILTLSSVFVLSINTFVACGSSEAANGNSEDVNNEDVIESGSGNLTKKIRVANFGNAVWNAQFVVADANGYFDEVYDGQVEIEVIPFQNGPAANEAFIAGDIDIVNGIGDQPIVIGIGNDVPTTILSGTAKQGANIGIIVPGDSGIKEVKDLKGKKVGVAIGTYVHKSLIGILKDAGVSEDEVEIANITSTSDADAAFASGDIDAYLSMSGYHIHQKVEEEGFVKIADCSKHPAYAYFVGATEFVNNNQELLEKFYEALFKAQQWIEDNPEEANKVIGDYADFTEEQVKYTLEGAEISLKWDEQYEQNLLDTYNFLEENGLITVKLSDEEILGKIDTTVVDGF